MERDLIAQHFYTNGMRTTIVASVNQGYDFAVYIGATPEDGISKDEAAEFIAKNGDKLCEAAARALFPNIEEVYRH